MLRVIKDEYTMYHECITIGHSQVHVIVHLLHLYFKHV